MATEATLLQAAASTAVAAFGSDGGKKAHDAFTRLVKRLSGDAGPEPVPKNMAKKGGSNGQ